MSSDTSYLGTGQQTFGHGNMSILVRDKTMKFAQVIDSSFQESFLWFLFDSILPAVELLLKLESICSKPFIVGAVKYFHWCISSIFHFWHILELSAYRFGWIKYFLCRFQSLFEIKLERSKFSFLFHALYRKNNPFMLETFTVIYKL